MMLEVRSATHSDAEALADLFIRSERSTYQEIKPARYLDGLDAVTELRRIQATITNTLTDIHQRLLVIEHDGIVVGFAELHCEFDLDDVVQKERCGVLERMCFAPESLGRGIGPVLHQAALGIFLNWQCTTAQTTHVIGNDRARNFYLGHGWTDTRRRRINPEPDTALRVVLVRTLD